MQTAAGPDPEAFDPSAVVAGLVATALGPAARVERAVPLTDGASRRTTALDVVDPDGRSRRLVLQQALADHRTDDRSMCAEAAVVRRARAAGVPVPEVLAAADGPGTPYTLAELVPGQTRPGRIHADPELAGVRAGFARRCGEVLAAIHRVPVDGLDLPAPGDPLDALRAELDRTGAAVPVFELALRELARTRPPPRPVGLVHGDFRMGNLVVAPDTPDAPGGLAAVLDWELAHRGDPVQDLGWLCVRAWRFRRAPVVGGVGEVHELLAGYAAAGAAVSPAELHWWLLHGTLRWGVMCLTMLDGHLRGQVRSVDRVAIGRRVAEQEWDLLDLLDPADAAGAPTERPAPPPVPDRPDPAPHDRPEAAELLRTVRELLRADVLPATDGVVAYHVRIAARLVGMVEAELVHGPADARRHRADLDRLGVPDDTALAAGVRAGELDDRAAELRAVLRTAVSARLAVSNPRHREPPTEADR